MISYCLVFADQDEAISVLGTMVSTSETSIVDIGEFYSNTGDADYEGEPITEAVNGYHVNILSRVELTHLNPYRVNPDTPSYSWLT